MKNMLSICQYDWYIDPAYSMDMSLYNSNRKIYKPSMLIENIHTQTPKLCEIDNTNERLRSNSDQSENHDFFIPTTLLGYLRPAMFIINMFKIIKFLTSIPAARIKRYCN